LIALAVVYFVWGVVTYVISSDEEAKKAGRDRIIFGIIGLAVIIGMWGLVNLLANTFSLNNSGTENLPTVPVVIPGNS
jgi:ABC-type thiamin/hydroxymethylpyrimidine transport system permease subunit